MDEPVEDVGTLTIDHEVSIALVYAVAASNDDETTETEKGQEGQGQEQ